ncbi:DUF3823 domain-containing protein [Galbibacter pacificus]|uniref:DUF3823 domain-containing protein n=1 Tax=Galbibacter pacificus TaxID=2996052 RepID=A0ABT6FVC5_9FLAO|nr:DUF3823 domain-containing protein [Galbibacter pacificus]MDG3583859.1 DUF3823 domain-containing protein [Galbibacter pacificus]MDG3587223.1 DUF3823 domain-containing protein [Galbibacter pacificus]
MKARYLIILIGAFIILASCNDIDNFDEPGTFLTGNVVYNQDPVPVGNNEVEFQLWQPGFGTLTPLGVRIAQDGSFSARLYNGDYKLVFVDGQGPFRTNIVNEQQQDTIFIDIDGDKEISIEVTPYYLIQNASFNKTGNSIEGTCRLEKIITDADAKNIERVTLYVNETQFVSDNGDYNDARIDGDFTNPNAVSMTVEIPEMLASKEYLYTRIGVKIAGVEDMIYSQVEKIDL